jgi:hypothetical protein
MDVIREALNFARKAVIPCASVVQRIMRHPLVQFKECVSLSRLRVISSSSSEVKSFSLSIAMAL